MLKSYLRKKNIKKRRIFGKENIKYVYQAYLPMHNSLVKEAEMQMLCMYYKKYNDIPACNPVSDLRRVKLRMEN